MGSRVFFENMPGFESKDIDELCIMDVFNLKGNSLHLNGLHGKDVFLYKDMSKERFIEDAGKLPMKVGKFLVPEFAEYLGMTIEDLKKLKPIIDAIDEKHEYEKVIFDSYIENNGFYLTDEQRERAFKIYKEKRNQ